MGGREEDLLEEGLETAWRSLEVCLNLASRVVSVLYGLRKPFFKENAWSFAGGFNI